MGNGALFWGLKYVPATTASFLFSLVPLLVLFMGALWLRELPTRWQIIGVVIGLAGAFLFFSPGFGQGEPLGTVIILAGLFGFAAFTILGRGVARVQEVDTLAHYAALYDYILPSIAPQELSLQLSCQTPLGSILHPSSSH